MLTQTQITDAEQAAADCARYHELNGKMRDCLTIADPGAFQSLWTELEAIKNRHGGMPPQPPDEQALELERCERANAEGLR